MNLLASTIVILTFQSANFASCNVVPIADITTSRWIPSASNRNKDTILRQGTVQSYSAYKPIGQARPVAPNNAKYIDSPGENSMFSAIKTDLRELPEPMPRMDDNDNLHKKLGLLSSLLPTSVLNMPQEHTQDEDNLVEVDSKQTNTYSVLDHDYPFNPQSFQQQPLTLQNVAMSSEDIDITSSSNEEDNNGGIISKIRHALFPFGSGLISGLLHGNGSDTDTGFDSSSVWMNENSQADSNLESSSIASNLFSFPNNPLQNPSNEDIDTFNNSDADEANFGILPKPFTFLKTIFQNIKAALNKTQEAPGYGSNQSKQDFDQQSDSSTEDSSISPLDSVSEGLTGVLRLFLPVISQFISTFGIAAANIPTLILIGSLTGPIIAAAIAGIVVGIVYVSFYVVAATVKNQGVDGEVVVLTLDQLISILGLQDTVDDIFGRSFNSRSLSNFALNGTTLPDNLCMERLACRLLSKRMNSPQNPSWVVTSLQWISNNVTPTQIDAFTPNRLSNSLRKGKSLIDAVVSGINDKPEPCYRYNCNPIMTIKNIFN